MEDDEEFIEPDKDGGNLIFDLSGPKKLIIKKYKGIPLVDIRETYLKEGKILYTQRGCSLTLDTWARLKILIPSIDRQLSRFK